MISSVQHLLPQAGVTADTTPTHKGKERLKTIGKWDMQSTWMLSASFKGEGKKPLPSQTNLSTFCCLLLSASQDHSRRHRCSTRTLAIARDHRAVTPVGCPEHEHTSSLSQGHGRSSSLICWIACPGVSRPGPPFPSHPKAPFL